MAAKLTKLTHKIAIQMHVVAKTCTICSTRSGRPVRELLDTASYLFLFLYKGVEASSTFMKFQIRLSSLSLKVRGWVHDPATDMIAVSMRHETVFTKVWFWNRTAIIHPGVAYVWDIQENTAYNLPSTVKFYED
jgi:hypothetical protein